LFLQFCVDVTSAWLVQHEFIQNAKSRDILQEMINEAQRLHEEFAQSSTGDSMTVSIAASDELYRIDL